MDFSELAQMLVFWLIAAFTGVCALATVFTQNIVRSATWLLFTLAGTSGIFFFLGADFIGAIQLLIYVGGTLVLVVFGVMLTAQGPFITMKTSGAEWAISIVAGITLFAVLCVGTSGYRGGTTSQTGVVEGDGPANSRHSATLAQALMGVGLGPVYKTDPRLFPGVQPTEYRIHYLLPFEIVSVHLLVVLIGAAYLARAKRKPAEQP
jgi:NADH-quinone oxidoreductase subunit J